MKEAPEPIKLDESKYFHRTVIYTRKDSEICLVDMHDATLTPPLDSWLGKVVELADGQHTLKDLYTFVNGLYKGNPPEGLELTLSSVVGRLIEGEIICLTNDPVDLPYYLALPAEKQDTARATELMKQDGYMGFPKNSGTDA
ncbi:hypothetical protein HOF92_01730 [bacterium]|jgi:hypothetical protein|nr:hypothetical protein [bacterium]